jgi:hypothetical protein
MTTQRKNLLPRPLENVEQHRPRDTRRGEERTEFRDTVVSLQGTTILSYVCGFRYGEPLKRSVE